MGLLDFFKKKSTAKMNYAPTMSGTNPFYSDFGESIYSSDIVIQSIRCKSNEFKKLQPRHIRIVNGNQTVITDSSVARVLKRPNAWMTQSDFLEKITIIRELTKNAFIYPEYYITKGGEKHFTALYPLKPSAAEYLVNQNGRLYLKLSFSNGYETTLPADSIIHWRKDFGVDDYFGGNALGNDDNKGLLAIIKRYDQLTQSISKALECSCQINGIMKYNSYIDDSQTASAREDFENHLRSNKSGILFTDMKTEYTPIQRDIKLVDSETLKFFHENILRANGTPLCILNGDYTKAQKEAYYEHSLESDIKSLGQAMSKVLFSDREDSFGNEVIFYPNSIEFMSMENKIAALQTGLPAGIFTKNEARELLGYAPIEGGDVMPRGYNEVDTIEQAEQESEETQDEESE